MMDSIRKGPEHQFRIALERFHRFESGFCRIADALKLAETAHAGQYRRSGSPYLSGAIRLAMLLRERGADLDVIIAGLVQDVIEDTAVSDIELESVVGPTVVKITRAVNHTSLGQGLMLSEESRTRRLALLFEREGVAELHACDRIVNMESIDGLPPAKRDAIRQETEKIVIPAIRLVGLQGLADDLANSLVSPQTVYQLPFDSLVESLVPRDFASFSQAIVQIDGPTTDTVLPDTRLILDRLEKLERGLLEEGSPSIKDLLGGIGPLDLKGVWTWAVYLSTRGLRSEEIVKDLEDTQSSDHSLVAMDEKTGGIIDTLLAVCITRPKETLIKRVAGLVARIRQ